MCIPPVKCFGTDKIEINVSTKQSPVSQEVSDVKNGRMHKFGTWLQGHVSKATLLFVRIFVLQSNT